MDGSTTVFAYIDPNGYSSTSSEPSDQSLYLPLDEVKNEVRLLTIISASEASDMVHCRLETVSLLSYCAEYRDYLNSALQGVSKRKLQADWHRSRSTEEISAGPNQDASSGYAPSTPCYRYKWGDYAALSYAWGSSEKKHQIIVNARPTYVTENLEAALRALSESSSFEDGFKIWVDALCINQEDYPERGSQVSKMRNIYGDAWAVIAWLGDSAHDSDQAIQFVRDLSTYSEPERAQQLEAKLQMDPAYLGDGSWIALHELMKRPYWYRLWIIQEVVLGASATTICCGKSRIDWKTFCTGIGVLHNHLWLIKDWLLRHELSLRKRALEDARWQTPSLHLVQQDLWPMSQHEEKNDGRLSYGRLLDLAVVAVAHDVRDRVYGLVGMMGPVIAQQLVPNYTIEPCEVFSAAARAFIRTYNSLDPIREGNPWGKTSTPSWAADWTWNGRIRYARTDTPTWGQYWNRKSFLQCEPYHASGDSSPEFSFSEDGRLLTCKGAIIDRIAGLGARAHGYFSWLEQSVVRPSKWKSVYGDVYGTAKALYRTLVQDRVDGQQAKPSHRAILSLPSTFNLAGPQFKRRGWKFLSLQHGYYFRWEVWRKANRKFWLGDRPLESFFTDVVPADASEDAYTEVYCSFDRTSKRRRLMTTEKGYIGWAPDNMFGRSANQTVQGDLIAVVFGCSTPIIIRPCGEYFQVVGEAYVQGLMDGEAMPFLNSGDVKTQNFTFC